MGPRQKLAILAVIATACAPLVAAATAPAPPSEESHARVTLLSEQSAFTPGKSIFVGVRFQLEPGWHVYWQNPGDSGTPPKIKWTLPQGFTAGSTKWPSPVRLGSGSVIDYGYRNDVLLMASVQTVSTATAPAMIGADVRYVVCREICIPGKAQLTFSIPSGAGGTDHFSPARDLFEKTRAELPKVAPAGWKAAARATKDNFILSVHGVSATEGINFFPVDAGVIDNSAPQKMSQIPRGFTLTLKKSDLLTGPVKAVNGLLNVPGQGSFEISAPVVQR